MQITETKEQPRGTIFTFEAEGKLWEILFIYHALERIKRWGLNEERVGETLLFPEEVLTGHRSRYIAHRRYNEHIIRAVYEYEGNLPVLITVYFPKSEKYFKGGGSYEDKILK